MKKFIRKITKISSHSYSIVLPKELIKKFGWREHQKIVISYGGRKEELKIKDWPDPPKTARFAGANARRASRGEQPKSKKK